MGRFRVSMQAGGDAVRGTRWRAVLAGVRRKPGDEVEKRNARAQDSTEMNVPIRSRSDVVVDADVLGSLFFFSRLLSEYDVDQCSQRVSTPDVT